MSDQGNRGGFFQGVADWTLKTFIGHLEAGEWSPSILASLHKWSADNPAALHDYIRNRIRDKGWGSTLTLLLRLSKTELREWLPKNVPPAYVFLDLEVRGEAHVLQEIAALRVCDTDADEMADDIDLGGLDNQRVQQVLARYAYLASYLVGHNLEEFDLPILQKRGISPPELPVLDTLVSSLILEPMKSHHRLPGGDHTARGDVKANRALFSTQEALWLNLPPVEFAWHRQWLGSHSGWAQYFEWLAFRHPAIAGAATTTPPFYQASARPPQRPALAESEVTRCLESARQDGVLALPRPIRGEDIPALASWAVSRGLVLVAPASAVWRYRQVVSAAGEVGVDSWILGDLSIDATYLQQLLQSEQRGPAASFLYRWHLQGGRSWHEIHPFARDWISPEQADRLFSQQASAPSAFVLDHAAWLSLSSRPRALVVDADRLEWAVHDAVAPSVTVDALDESVMLAAASFLQNRLLSWSPTDAPTGELLLTLDDQRSDDYQALLEALRGKHPNKASQIPSLVSGASIHFSLLSSPAGGPRLRFQLLQHDPAGWLRTNVTLGGHMWATGPVSDGTFLGMRISAVRSAEMAPLQAIVYKGRVAPDSRGGPLQTAAERILEAWKNDRTHAPSFLGGTPAGRIALATLLNKRHVFARTETHFGTRNRTVDRLQDQPVSFLADPRPVPMPSLVKTVLIEKLPFPRRDDPLVVAAIRALRDPDRAVEDVVLPHMLKRLTSMVSDLEAQGIKPILLDRRAATVPEIRVAIEALRYRIEAVDHVQADVLRRDERLSLGAAVSPPKTPERRSTLNPFPVLRRIYGDGAKWRPRQEEIVQSILQGENVLVVMPTGSGKSACFQVPALALGSMHDALTVVFSPLQALMRDQVTKMQSLGVYGVERFDSSLDEVAQARVLRNIRVGWTVMLYMAPEQLMNERTVAALLDRGVSLLVVDEAHCVSEWGHSFRPDYRRIPRFVDQLEEVTGVRPQVAAFTATAPRGVRSDVRAVLGLGRTINLGVQRSDLVPRIVPLSDEPGLEERLSAVEPFLREHAGQPGLIYALSKKAVEDVAEALRRRNLPGFPPETIDFYHSDVPDRMDREKRYIAPNAPTRLMVCTTAFGMGIDKPDIHWVIHLYGAGSVEAFAQEIGRAARDPMLQGHTLSLASSNDHTVWENMADLVGEQQVRLVLRTLQGLQIGDDLVVDWSSIADAAGLNKEEHAYAAVSALERAGALEVLGRGHHRYRLSRGSSAEPVEPRSFEEAVLAAVPPAPEEREIDLRAFDACGISLEERGNRVKAMLEKGFLVTRRGVQVEALGRDRQARADRLSAVSRVLRQAVEWLQRAVSEGGGKYLELADETVPRALDLSPHDWLVALDDLRALSIVYADRTKNGLKLTLTRRESPVTLLEQADLARRQLLERCEEAWRQNGPSSRLYFGEDRRKVRRSLGGLSLWEILAWKDDAPRGQCFRIRLFDCSADSLQLDLRAQQSKRWNRFEALRRLFGEAREGGEVWAFLRDYFEGRGKRTLRPELAPALLADLTDAQKGAVQCPSTEPLLINAVAGSGKTHVLARRILYLQACEGLFASRLLVLSHSRAGAGAIGERVRALAAIHGLGAVRCQTFHAYCNSLYRQLGGTGEILQPVKLPDHLWSRWARRAKIYNSLLVEEYNSLLLHFPPSSKKRAEPAQIIEDYGALLDAVRQGHPSLPFVVIEPDELRAPSLPEWLELPNGEGAVPVGSVADLLERYQNLMRERNVIDFSGMITEALRTLRNDIGFRETVRERIEHILVDEFQDTSRAQEELFRLLVGDEPNITVVGDNDQTIYTFNGSDVENILQFADRNDALWVESKTRILALEDNFRSTPNILDLAGRFIIRNRRRLPKTIRPGETVAPSRQPYRVYNAPVVLVTAESSALALDHAFSSVTRWLQEGVKPEEICVLSRINPAHDSSRALLNLLGNRLRAWGVATCQPDGSMSARDVVKTLNKNRVPPDTTLESLLDLGDDELSERFKVEAEAFRESLSDAVDRGLQRVGQLADELAPLPPGIAAGPRTKRKGVRLKTIHAAKGEEYRRVIVMNRTQFPWTRMVE